MGWTVGTITGTTAQITLYGVTGEVVLKGLPGLHTAGGQVVTGIGLTPPNVLVVQFDSTLPSSPTFIWPALDEAVRTSLGAFVAPATIQFVSPFGDCPDTATLDTTQTLEAQKVSTLIVDGGTVYLPSATDGQWAVVINPTTGLFDITVNYGGSSFTVTPGTSGRFLYTTPAWARL